MQKLRDYLTAEGWKKDLEETIENLKNEDWKKDLKGMVIFFTPFYGPYRFITDNANKENSPISDIVSNKFSRCCYATSSSLFTLQYIILADILINKFQ